MALTGCYMSTPMNSFTRQGRQTSLYRCASIALGLQAALGAVLLPSLVSLLAHSPPQVQCPTLQATRTFVLQEVLAKVPPDVDTLVFPNYESLPEREDVADPFTEVTLFKKNYAHVLSGEQHCQLLFQAAVTVALTAGSRGGSMPCHAQLGFTFCPFG